MTNYEQEKPMPPVRSRCRRCKVTEAQVRMGRVVVSPRGVAHHGMMGSTDCGLDATKPGYWWPL